MNVTLYSHILKPFSNAKFQAWLLQVKKGDAPNLQNRLALENWTACKPLMNKVTIDLLIHVLTSCNAHNDRVKIFLDGVVLSQEQYIMLTNNATIPYVFADGSTAYFNDDRLMQRTEKIACSIDDTAQQVSLEMTRRRFLEVHLNGYKHNDTLMNLLVPKIIAWKKEAAFTEYASRTRWTSALLGSPICPMEFALKWVYKSARKKGTSRNLDIAILQSPSPKLMPLKIRMLNKFPWKWYNTVSNSKEIQRLIKVTITAKEVPHATVLDP